MSQLRKYLDLEKLAEHAEGYDKLVDNQIANLADGLLERALKASDLDQADVDDTAFRKSGHLARSPCTSLKWLVPFRTSSPSSQSRHLRLGPPQSTSGRNEIMPSTFGRQRTG